MIMDLHAEWQLYLRGADSLVEIHMLVGGTPGVTIMLISLVTSLIRLLLGAANGHW
jgi:hypothetical protein